MNIPFVVILGGLVYFQFENSRVPGIVTWIHEHGALDLTLFLRGGLLQYRDRVAQGEPGEVGTWHVPPVPHVTVTETKLAEGDESGEEKETLTKKKK